MSGRRPVDIGSAGRRIAPRTLERRQHEADRLYHELKLPSYTGFVMPKLTPVHGGDGKISDVKISYPMDLTQQMLEYSGVKR